MPISLRRSGHGGDPTTTEAPPTYTPANHQHLSGKWLYGGNWMNHFGHFITEGLTTLWPRVRGVRGIVCHPYLFGNSVTSWHEELLFRMGWDVPVIVATHGAIVDELIVPERPVTLNHSIAPQAINVWGRVASAGTPSRDVFLSRSKLPPGRRDIPGDERLDDLMAGIGFDVLHPQEMPITEQLDAVAGARVLAGVSGSALHLSAFTHAHTRVLELGDTRTPHKALPFQRIIDDAAGRPSGFVPYTTREGEPRDLALAEQAITTLLTT